MTAIDDENHRDGGHADFALPRVDHLPRAVRKLEELVFLQVMTFVSLHCAYEDSIQ